MKKVDNPYDLSNQDVLISVVYGEEESNTIALTFNPEETPARLVSIFNTLENDEEPSNYELVSPSHNIPLDGDFFTTTEFEDKYELDVYESEMPGFDYVEDVYVLYDKMKLNNLVLKPNLLPELIYKQIMGINTYSSTIFVGVWQKIMMRAIIDISQGENYVFLRSLIPYFHQSAQVNQDFPFLITNSIVSAMTIMFVNRKIRSINPYEDELDMSYNPEWFPFLHFISELVVRRLISYECIRNSLDAFRPSIISEQFIISLATNILTALPVHETFKICSELFKDKYLFRSFRNPSVVHLLLQKPDISQVFPYLYIYGWMSRAFNSEVSLQTAIAAALNVGEQTIFDSKRILKTFLDSIIETIYEKFIFLPFAKTYLELTSVQVSLISIELERYEPIFVEFIKSKELMIALLERVHILLAKYSYFPKGITLLLYKFLWDKGICSTPAFNIWFEQLNTADGATGIMLELNSPLNSVIPLKYDFSTTMNLSIIEQVKADLKKKPAYEGGEGVEEEEEDIGF
ncbi:hypothetical protein TRFO_16544 [Tritrichomonas foetus]|uniref:Uncharacterized protein n=1 Tax=Tritrichomonas foetus TaxID=1144522 RepID=A0A1J4KUA2_9EUKA|nr:hypothetical protein TRFO_16544 [Tritrichomonas foetus]|eukprot:OHT13340.1 hypothetical protein TRFO_16544 [Tritrichomonas foetus]